MQILRVAIPVVFLCSLNEGFGNEPLPADATATEHVRTAIAKLDAADFRQREAAVEDLLNSGLGAVFAITDAALQGSPEVSVRAFDVLQRLYWGEDEAKFEQIEHAFQVLAKSDNLAVAARAERAFETISDTRQDRAVVQFEKLGGIIRFNDRHSERQPFGRPRIENIMLCRDWVGGDDGLQLLTRIDDLKNARSALYIIRGVEISKEAKSNLLAEFPFMDIQERGPARLGIMSRNDQREGGCVINDVDPGSAAEAAGLRALDQVLEIAGERVDNFEALIKIIEKKEPGDKVSIVFRRGGEKHEAVAELSPWKPSGSARAKR